MHFSSLKKRDFSTPQFLKAALYMTWGASLLLVVTTISGIQSQRHAIKTVGKDAAPSVLAAQQIKDSLADMGANAANQLLVKPGSNPEADKGFESRRQKLGTLIVAASKNITYGEEESKPLTDMVNGLTQYMLTIQQARDANARGERANMLAAYYEAVKVNEQQIQPAADALSKVNLDNLNRIYELQTVNSVISLLFITIAGLFLLAVLIATQLFLYRRMRRIVNPMLATATAISVIFLGYTFHCLQSASSQLKIAKEDAFISLYSLRQARALAYGANRDESRYLLDTANQVKHEQAFKEKINKIAQPPNGKTLEWTVTNNVNPGFGLSGLLGEEFKNITFDGEREAVIKTVKTLVQYLAIDERIRQLERSGKHAEAIQLCVSSKPGDSNWAFEEFKVAHQKVMDINQAAFDKAIEQGSKNVENFEIKVTGVAIIISVLVLLGMRDRIKEYEI
jgi:hypothetical protein